jgi:hypothetical protein
MALSAERYMGQGEAETMTLSQYTIYSHWGARAETPEVLAQRFICLIDRLAPLHPAFNNWTWVGRERVPRAFEPQRDNLPSAIAANVSRSDWDTPEPHMGYYARVTNTIGKTTPSSLSVATRGGAQYQSCAANHGYITTGWRVEPDPSIVTYAVFKPALLAVSEIYDVDWCSAYPDDIMELWPRDQTYRMPWMCYIKPAWAPLLTPPPTAIVEYWPNGALFMAATDETFITANPAHLAVARDIEAALAPLNALPEAGSQ